MNDPYKVLGVSRNSSDDDIKRAYRDMAKKYHPDNYLNNPLNDLAQEKMKEINEAYDEILKQRAGKHNTDTSSSQGSYRYGGGNAEYARIRAAIASNNLVAAESLLNSIHTHDAEWHFLMGSIMYRRGWFDDARSFFRTACDMDPQNPEYLTALNQMSMAGNPYRMGMGGISPCDCCASLICADCCCSCLGG